MPYDDTELVIDGDHKPLFRNDVQVHFNDVGDDDEERYTLSVKVTHEGVIFDLWDAKTEEYVSTRAWTAYELAADLLE